MHSPREAQQQTQQLQEERENDELLQLLEGFLADDLVDVASFADSAGLLGSDEASTTTAALTNEAICVDHQQQAQLPTSSDDTGGKELQQQVKRVRGRRRPQPPRKSDPNKARNERKQELVYLHRKVDELEAQLRDLRSRAAPVAGSVAGASLRPRLLCNEGAEATGRQEEEADHRQLVKAQSQQSKRDSSSADAAVWQGLVDRQRELRVKSEKENVRLKLVLETQLKVVKSLEKMLLKPTATRELEKSLKGVTEPFAARHAQFPMIVPPSRPLPPDPTSDARVFDELLAGVTQSYAEIDALFNANGLAHKETAFSDARVRRDDRGEMFMEICANKVLPFAVRATGEAVWHHFVFGKEKVPFRFHTDNVPKVFLPTVTSYLKDFGLEVHAKHKSASFRIKQVIRQHVERERVVIVWCAAIDPVAFSDQPLPGNTGIVEKGYIVMKPSSLSSSGGGGGGNALTLLQMCHIITPKLRVQMTESSASEFFRVGALTDFVMSATASNVTTSYHIVEDMLLEQFMKTATHKTE